MRILHVIPSIAERWGGPSKVVIEMCKYQNALGVDAEIVTTHFFSEMPRFHKEVIVHSFRSYFHGNYSPSFRLWIKDNIGKYDLIHIHSIFHECPLVTARQAKRNKVPYIIRPLGHLYPWSLKNRNMLLKKFFLVSGGFNILENAETIHFTTEHERDTIAFKIKNRSNYVLPIGIESVPIVSKETFHNLFPELVNKNIILFLSRIHRKKGLDLLIPAISNILKEMNDWVLVIAGEGEKRYTKSIKEKAENLGIFDKVYFIGFVREEKKCAILQHSHIFILPSYSENFGIVVAEAMQSGLPVLISSEVAIAKDVENAKSGLIFSLNIEEIRKSILEVINNPQLRIMLGENGGKLVKRKYDWNIITKKQIEIYKEIIGE